MTEQARETPPVKDDIAIQHRPDSAQSRHSSLGPTERDRAHTPREHGGPPPDADEIEAAHGRGPTSDLSRGETGAAAIEAAPDALTRSAPSTIEVLPPEHPKIKQIERLADWLDTRFRIPVVNYPIGLDGLIGLIPGVGDTITTGLSAYLMYEAHQAGASKRTLGKMGVNVGIDWLLGLIPVVGDLIDVGYKANAKNARLLVEELRRLDTQRRPDTTPRP